MWTCEWGSTAAECTAGCWDSGSGSLMFGPMTWRWPIRWRLGAKLGMSVQLQWSNIKGVVRLHTQAYVNVLLLRRLVCPLWAALRTESKALFPVSKSCLKGYKVFHKSLLYYTSNPLTFGSLCGLLFKKWPLNAAVCWLDDWSSLKRNMKWQPFLYGVTGWKGREMLLPVLVVLCKGFR